MRDAVATAFKVRENRARRVLERMGHRLEKSPRRDPRASDFGLYRIVRGAADVVAGDGPQGFGMSLPEVETWIQGVPLGRAGTHAAGSPPPSAKPKPRAREDRPVTLHVGDCRDVLRRLPAGLFHACVTSPPYYFVRDFGHADQIGLEDTPDEYVAALVDVFRQVWRVLHPRGTVWLNVADTFCTRRAIRPDGRRSVTRDMNNGTNSQEAWRESARNGRTLYSSRLKAAGLKDKDLMLIPARLALALQRSGWWVRASIAWVKPNTAPDPASDRPARCHETVLLLAKSERYHFDASELRERAANGGLRPGRDVWTIRPSARKGDHSATFPDELAAKCILAGAPPGSRVLDIFAGSGTVGLVAAQHGRRATLVELSPDHAQEIRDRLGDRLGEAPLRTARKK